MHRTLQSMLSSSAFHPDQEHEEFARLLKFSHSLIINAEVYELGPPPHVFDISYLSVDFVCVAVFVTRSIEIGTTSVEVSATR